MASPSLLMRIVGNYYRLDAPLGEGGFGIVHRAVDTRINQPVAIKLLRRELMGTGDVEARFMREAELARRLEHPNTVRLLDFGRADDGTPFLVYELLSGETLADLLLSQGRLAPERAAHIGGQMLKSLLEAHRLGIVHRDIKPANVFISSHAGASDFVKVLDFGIAKAPEGMTMLTQTGVVMGTPSYMAPEQVRSEPVGPAVDVYAVGLVLGEMLAGRVIVRAQTPLLTAMEQMSDRPVPLPPEVTATALAPVVHRATQKRVEHRYGSAHEMLAELETAGASQVLPHSPLAHAPTAPAGNPFAAQAMGPMHPQAMHPMHAPPMHPPRSGRGLIIGILVVVTLLVVGGGAAGALVYFASKDETTEEKDDKPTKKRPEPEATASSSVAPAPLTAGQHDELHRRVEGAGYKIVNHRLGGDAVSTDTAESKSTSATLVISDLGSDQKAEERLNTFLADGQFVGAALREGTHVLVVRATQRPSGAPDAPAARDLVLAIAGREPNVLRAAAGAPPTTAAPATATPATAQEPVPSGEPVAAGGVPAQCVDVCKRLGRCGGTSSSLCVVRGDADCRQSDQCSVRGRCGKQGDSCMAKSASDCRNSSLFRTDGQCAHSPEISNCGARDKADCEASTRCASDGACSVGSGICVPLTEAECQRSQRCKTQGICSLSGNSCVKK